jgi:hypothetical protein
LRVCVSPRQWQGETGITTGFQKGLFVIIHTTPTPVFPDLTEQPVATSLNPFADSRFVGTVPEGLKMITDEKYSHFGGYRSLRRVLPISREK